jgi:hypothetical protein
MQSPTFSIYKPNSNSASFERFLQKKRTLVGYDTKTEFSAGLAWVKTKTLSEIGLGSRVRSGNWVKTFSLVRAGRFGRVSRVRVAGLFELSSSKVKTSSQAGFSIIRQPGLG